MKISAPTWNDTFDLTDDSYSKTLTENPPVQIYSNKIKSRIVFNIKTGYKLELLTPETIKLFVSTKKEVDKDKDGENVPKLKSVEAVLLQCNLVKNDYQHIKSFVYFCSR